MNERFTADEILEYHRKSRQDDPSKTVTEVLAQHKRIADDWVSKNLNTQVPDENIYMERVSGETIRDRAEFRKVLKRIESPEIKAVFVIETQRLSRGDLEDAGHIINVFRYSHTRIITPHRIYNLDDDGDRMILEMELKQGNQYLEYTKAILKRGKDDAVRRGVWVLSCPPYGYDIAYVDGKRTLAVNHYQADAVRKMFEMYADGKGVHKIQKYMYEHRIKPAKTDIFSRTTVNAILKNPVYIGKIRWNTTHRTNTVQDGKIKKIKQKVDDYELYDGLHEPIISKELFDKVQAIKGSYAHLKSDTTMVNPLAGLLKCGKCGATMKHEGVNDKHQRFACINRTMCGNGSVIVDYIFEDVKAAIRKEIATSEIVIQNNREDLVKRWEEECRSLRSRIAQLDERELKQWSDRYESDNPMPDAVFRKLNDKLISDRNALRLLLKTLEENKPSQDAHLKRIADLNEVLSGFGTLSAEEHNKLLKMAISRITITRERSENVHNSYITNPYTIKIEFKI